MSMPRTPSAPPLPTALWVEKELPDVEENLALDEAILDAIGEDPPAISADPDAAATRFVRLWTCRETVVVVGSSSRVDDEVDREACRRVGARIVRRPSGGATVVIGPGCVMWSVVERLEAGIPSIDGLHERFLGPLTAALGRRGLSVSRRGTSDLAVGDRKFSGNSLRVKRRAVLYHGTFLDTFDLSLIDTLLPHPPREPAYRSARSHRDFVVNIGLGLEPIRSAVREAFDAFQGSRWFPEDRVQELLAARYRRHDWTERL